MREDQYIIIDDFYSDPDVVRQFALDENYASVAKLNYPGYQSHKVFKSQSIQEAFEKAIGKEIIVDPERFTFGGFRLITEETGKMPKVHADSIDWAGLVFLSNYFHQDAGVGFYRHKETGLIGPPTDLEARSLGYEDAAEFERQIIYRDQANLDAWELTFQVEPIYNRLVLFKGRELYHAPIKGFGSIPEDCRITHNFFFLEKK
ncbi:DUF6445 family protein [Viridibacillus arvi]|uniref:DUF6445 family protein n=1 Tax=Viridibacillus arvi TaxID=263475 RepID=UPI003D002A04